MHLRLLLARRDLHGVEQLHHVQRRLRQDIAHALKLQEAVVAERAEVILGQEVAPRQQQVGRDRIREVVAAEESVWVLRQLDLVAVERGGARRRVGHGPRRTGGGGAEVDGDGGAAGCEGLEADAEVREEVPHSRRVHEDLRAVVEGLARGGIAVGVGVAAEAVFLLDQRDAGAELLQPDGGIGTAGAAADDDDVPLDGLDVWRNEVVDGEVLARLGQDGRPEEGQG